MIIFPLFSIQYCIFALCFGAIGRHVLFLNVLHKLVWFGSQSHWNFSTSLRHLLNRTILGGHTDTSIDVSDPISDRFYKEVWMTTSGRNATIYEKVKEIQYVDLFGGERKKD